MRKKLKVIVLFFFWTQLFMAQSPLKESKHASLITNYLKSNLKMAKFSNTDLEDLYINKEIITQKTGLTNMYLNQRYKGIKIFNAISTVGIKNENIFHFASKFETNISEKINTVKVAIGPSEAVGKFASHYRLGSTGNLDILEETNNKVVFSKGNVSQEQISVEKVYFKDKDGLLKLAWDLNILTIDGRHWWSAKVDAISGKVLNVDDWMLSCNFGNINHANHNYSLKSSFNLFETKTNMMVDGSQYNVFSFPTESPNHGPRTIELEPSDAIASPFGWHDDDGVAGAEYTTTQGNNVIAQDDSDGNDGTGYQPDGGASLNFDFAIDLSKTASASIDASITNLFYVNNMVHDIIYQYGFDIATGAFQEKHYQRQNFTGAGDPVFADGLDGSGLNNANFGTPPDGTSPRMQMFLWNSSNGNALTINGGSLDGGYVGLPAGFGGSLSEEIPVTGDLVLSIDDDAGDSTDPYDACDAIINGAELVGKIALINRGTCEFGVKVLAAQIAGAIAAIVITDDRPVTTMGVGATNPNSVIIPSIMISREDGDAIIAALNNSETLSASLIQPPFIDGNYDNGVIIHEYAHGISNRLTGGATDVSCLIQCTERDENENCIPATRTEQMGEGWSDWFTLMLTMKASDVGTTGRGVGTFDLEQPTDGPGIRPYRYSTDTSINPLTYNDSNNTAAISAPHGVGSVWCTMLWDLTWAYVEKYGFDSNIYSGTGGNNKVMQIVMDAMKLQVCQPGFVDGRDAILAADVALTGGEDQCMIWEVFAARGLGVNADQGSSLLRTDQVEDFTMPDPSDPSLLSCTTLSSDSFNSKDYRVYPNPTNGRLTIKSGKSLGDVMINLFDINGRQVLTKKATLMGEVELNVSNLKSGLYILNIKGDFINTNEKIIIN